MNTEEIQINTVEDLLEDSNEMLTIDDLPYKSFNDLYLFVKFEMGVYLPPKRDCNKKWLAKMCARDAVFLDRNQVSRACLPLYAGFKKRDLLDWIS